MLFLYISLSLSQSLCMSVYFSFSFLSSRFNDELHLEHSIDASLRWLEGIATLPGFKNKVFWHETMSQHWPNPIKNGYFDVELGKKARIALEVRNTRGTGCHMNHIIIYSPNFPPPSILSHFSYLSLLSLSA